MKKKLLLLMLPMVLFTLGVNAQDKIWDIGTDWVAGNAVGAGYIKDGLTVGPTTGNFRVQILALPNNTATFPEDGYSAKKGIFYPSGSAVSANTPTDNFLAIPVTGPCTLELWTSATNSSRKLYVSDGTNLLLTGLYTGASAGAGPNFLCHKTVDFTGASGGILYVYASSQLSVHKISVVYPVANPLATDSFKVETVSSVYVNGNEVFVSNVKSNTTVAVYSVAGALVKTVETSGDTSFELASGVYVAKVKSAEGEKSVKLLVK